MSERIIVDGITFIVDNEIERYRAETLLTKEEGTIRWLNKLNPGDVLYDIGANIGCYTLYAAKRGAFVYAFEPHIGNAWKLMQNIEANGLTDRVMVVCAAIHHVPTVCIFNYRAHMSGSSGSQLGHAIAEDGNRFNPASCELKVATSIDRILGIGPLRPPTHIKIDVDGNEYKVLVGATETLHSSSVVSVQVELNSLRDRSSKEFMEQCGWKLVERHYTMNGQRQLDAGVPPEQIIHNGVFERV